MGLFNKLFNGTSDTRSYAKASKREGTEKQLPWIALDSIEQLDAIEANSKTKTQLIFKHSTRCGISRMVLSQFEATYDVDANADLYYLDLLVHRDISNAIASMFDVVHQSPQLLVVKNGVAVAHESHGGINEMDLGGLV